MASAVPSSTGRISALVLSHFFPGGNRIFEDYCNGIRANVQAYHYVDYVELYRTLGQRRFESRIETLVEQHGATHLFLIWWSCDLTFDPRFIARLSQRVRVVMNFFDTEYFFEDVDRYYAQVADLVLLPDELSRYKYEQLGVAAHTSFSLFDSRIYRPAQESKDIDISFVGDMRQGGRAELLQLLRDNGLRVEAYGAGTKNGFVPFEEMVRIFSRSRINLNFTGLVALDNYAIALPRINQRMRQSKGRPIEIALCGGFVLSQYAPGIEHMFVPGQEFDVFRNPQELLEKVNYYLAHESEREAIARRGYDRATANYDTAAGFGIALNRLAALPRPEPQPLYLDRRFVRSHAAFRWFYVSQFALQGRIALAAAEFFKSLLCAVDPRAGIHFAVRGVIDYARDHPHLQSFFKRVGRLVPVHFKY